MSGPYMKIDKTWYYESISELDSAIALLNQTLLSDPPWDDEDSAEEILDILTIAKTHLVENSITCYEEFSTVDQLKQENFRLKNALDEATRKSF